MNRDELIEKVAKSMFDGERGFSTDDGFKNQIQPIRDRYCSYAIVAIDNIFAAMPAEKPLPDLMLSSYHEVVGWNEYRAAMLQASPLAPEGGRG